MKPRFLPFLVVAAAGITVSAAALAVVARIAGGWENKTLSG
jgi:hypothetical protein